MKSALSDRALACLLILAAIGMASCSAAGSTLVTVAAPPMQIEEPPESGLWLPTDRRPSGVVVGDEGVFLSVPRWDGGAWTLARWEPDAEEWRPWPPGLSQDPEDGAHALHSVNGLHLDAEGRLWVLDNARINLGPHAEGAAKLVVLDTATGQERWRHVFDEESAPVGRSFLNDLAVDPDRGVVYITDTGMGGPGALVVLELFTGRAWRTLVGHPSLQADPDEEMRIDGEVATVGRDGERVPWRVGANPIALVDAGERLLFGAMTHRTLFQIEARWLREPHTEEARVEAVSAWGQRGMADGMAARGDGTLLLTDVEQGTVRCHREGEPAVPILEEGRASFPVAVFAPEGPWVYFTANALHQMPLLWDGEERSEGPWGVWRVYWPSTGSCVRP